MASPSLSSMKLAQAWTECVGRVGLDEPIATTLRMVPPWSEPLWGEWATVALGAGDLPLVEALLKRGVVPTAVRRPSTAVASLGFDRRFAEQEGWNWTHMVAFLGRFDRWRARNNPPTFHARLHHPKDVLDFGLNTPVFQDAHWWSQLTSEGMTPWHIAWMRVTNNQLDPGFFQSLCATDEPWTGYSWLQRLEQAGAQPSLWQPSENALSNAIPPMISRDYYPDRRDPWLWVDRLLAWPGLNAQALAPVALAHAILMDGPLTHNARRVIGPRTRGLLDRHLTWQDPGPVSALGHPLVSAIRTGRASIVKHLVDAGMDYQWVDPSTGENPVFIAPQDDTPRVLAALSTLPDEAARAWAQARRFDGKTALHLMVHELNVPRTRWLLEHGADAQALDAKGRTPLGAQRRNSARAQSKKAEMFTLLQSHGAQSDADGSVSLLHYAIASCLPELLEERLKAGDDPKKLDARRRTPWSYLLSGAATNREAWRAMDRNDHKRARMVHLLAQAGVDVCQPMDKDKDTALHRAVRLICPHTCQALLDCGAPVDLPDGSGAPPLEQTNAWSFSGHGVSQPALDIVRLFAQAGADVSAPLPSGRYPLHHRRTEDGVKEVLAYCQLNRTLEGASEESPRPRRRM